jgi:hypothetical protein
MRLDMPVLENLVKMTKASGTEVFYTVVLPDGTSKTVDVNMAWGEILNSFRALEHFLDEPYRKAQNYNPGGKAIGEL